jgi:hypothetical protein
VQTTKFAARNPQLQKALKDSHSDSAMYNETKIELKHKNIRRKSHAEKGFSGN